MPVLFNSKSIEVVAFEREDIRPARMSIDADRAYVVVTEARRPPKLTVVSSPGVDLEAAVAEAEDLSSIAVRINPDSDPVQVHYNRQAVVLLGEDFSYLVPARNFFDGAADVRATLASRGDYTAFAFEPMAGPGERLRTPPPQKLQCPGPPRHALWLLAGMKRYCETHERTL
ncbi:MAG TPA: hypothetical protein VG458_09430 [Solirubrobacterales bacterium]|nr:hypothetical protein [Solirubrobacterales bacterium]